MSESIVRATVSPWHSVPHFRIRKCVSGTREARSFVARVMAVSNYGQCRDGQARHSWTHQAPFACSIHRLWIVSALAKCSTFGYTNSSCRWRTLFHYLWPLWGTSAIEIAPCSPSRICLPGSAPSFGSFVQCRQALSLHVSLFMELPVLRHKSFQRAWHLTDEE